MRFARIRLVSCINRRALPGRETVCGNIAGAIFRGFGKTMRLDRSFHVRDCLGALIAVAAGLAIAGAPRAAVAQSATVYVDDSYSGTQTGTQSQPFNTIQAAVNAAAANATIAIAGGTYNEAVSLPARSLTLNGGYAPGFGSRDANQFPVRIQGTSANAVIRSTAGSVTYVLDGLTLSGGNRGVWFDSGGTMTAR